MYGSRFPCLPFLRAGVLHTYWYVLRAGVLHARPLRVGVDQVSILRVGAVSAGVSHAGVLRAGIIQAGISPTGRCSSYCTYVLHTIFLRAGVLWAGVTDSVGGWGGAHVLTCHTACIATRMSWILGLTANASHSW